jgi:hypothetical protein
MQVTVKYGIEKIEKNVNEGTTVGQLIGDPNIRAVFGCGDNVRALINGVEMGTDVRVPANATVVFETRCNSKATLVLA